MLEGSEENSIQCNNTKQRYFRSSLTRNQEGNFMTRINGTNSSLQPQSDLTVEILTPAEHEAVDRFCQALGLALRRISGQYSALELSHLPQPIENETAGERS
jgi:hypothetical protein